MSGQVGQVRRAATADAPGDAGDDGCGLATLLKYVSQDRRSDLIRYAGELIESADYTFDYQFLGFISDYISYAEILKAKADVHDAWPPWEKKKPRPPLTIYDVGCGGALQHLVFDPRTDTVGSMAGAMAGAFWGYEAIPKDLVSGLERHREIRDLELRLLGS